MKTYVTHGLYIALAGLVVALLMFVTGMHSDAAKLALSSGIRTVCHWGCGILFIALAVRERRAAADPARAFAYGDALWAGVATALWTALFDLVWVTLYFAVIDPHMNEILLQNTMAKYQAHGMDGARLDQMERIMHYAFTPWAQAGIVAFGAVIGGTIVALVVAACLQRPAEPAQA
jgi:hypothetical protein